jgi:hypothetical protein
MMKEAEDDQNDKSKHTRSLLNKDNKSVSFNTGSDRRFKSVPAKGSFRKITTPPRADHVSQGQILLNITR